MLIGSLGLTLFAIDLSFAHTDPLSILDVMLPMDVLHFVFQLHNWHILMDILCMGIFGGFYIVPLYTFIQQNTHVTFRSRVIAANNIINAIFMVAASIMAICLFKIGFSIPQLFFVTGLLNAIVGISLYFTMPAFKPI